MRRTTIRTLRFIANVLDIDISEYLRWVKKASKENLRETLNIYRNEFRAHVALKTNTRKISQVTLKDRKPGEDPRIIGHLDFK